MPNIGVGVSSTVRNGDATSITLPQFSDGEIPAGTINSSNISFTLTNAPNPISSLILFYNGVLQPCTINGTTITMPTAPDPGDSIVAYYRY